MYSREFGERLTPMIFAIAPENPVIQCVYSLAKAYGIVHDSLAYLLEPGPNHEQLAAKVANDRKALNGIVVEVKSSRKTSTLFGELNRLIRTFEDGREWIDGAELINQLDLFREAYDTYIVDQTSANAVRLVLASWNVKRVVELMRPFLDALFGKFVPDNEVPADQEDIRIVIHGRYDFSQFIDKLDAVNRAYRALCQMLKEPNASLTIVKVESGSAMLELFGQATPIGLLGMLIYLGAQYAHRRLTKSGKIENLRDLMHDSIELREKLRTHGIDLTKADENLKAANENFTAAIAEFLDDEPAVTINGKRVGVPENEVAGFLEQRTKKLEHLDIHDVLPSPPASVSSLN